MASSTRMLIESAKHLAKEAFDEAWDAMRDSFDEDEMLDFDLYMETVKKTTYYHVLVCFHSGHMTKVHEELKCGYDELVEEFKAQKAG